MRIYDKFYILYKDRLVIDTGLNKRSNCFKGHPQTDAGHCAYCGQDISSNRYIHFAPEF